MCLKAVEMINVDVPAVDDKISMWNVEVEIVVAIPEAGITRNVMINPYLII